MTSVTAADADQVFAALADPTRRELLELLGGSPGRSASALAALVPVSRQAVAQHLAVLGGMPPGPAAPGGGEAP